MNKVQALIHSSLALAAAVFPLVATAAAELLDQSTRRPSLAGLVMHSLQSAF